MSFSAPHIVGRFSASQTASLGHTLTEASSTSDASQATTARPIVVRSNTRQRYPSLGNSGNVAVNRSAGTRCNGETTWQIVTKALSHADNAPATWLIRAALV